MFSPSHQVILTWKEPWLFQLRTSTKIAWWLRVMFFVAVYIVFAVLLHMDDKTKGPAFTPVGKVVMPALIAAVFLTMFEVPHLQRIVTISHEGISCDGAFMMFGGPIHWIAGMRRWNWRELKQVQLLRPGEAGNVFDFGQMIVMPKYAGSKRLAVPLTTALNDLADCLHARGVDVLLSHWSPRGTEQCTA